MPTLSQALQAITNARYAEGCSERTLERYHWAITRVIKQTGDIELETVPPQDVRTLLADMRRAGNTMSTLETFYRTLHAFFAWSATEYRLGYNPMDAVNKPKLPHSIPAYLTEPELRAMFTAARRTRNPARDVALLMFMLDTGVRSEEARTLKREQINLDTQRARVIGKGRRERFIPFSTRTKAALLDYWQTRHDGFPWAFVSKTADDGALTKSGVLTFSKRLAKAAKLERRVYPHIFRHTFACRWIIAGGDLETLRRILGHTNLAVTLRYLGLAVDDLQARHDAVNPLGTVADTL